MSKVISVCDQYGSDVSSRSRAHMLRLEIERLVMSEDMVVLDFSNVASISDSFSDELVGVLVEQRGTQWFKNHVRIIGLAERERKNLLSVVQYRLSNPEAPPRVAVG
jgi:hypothetical protein